jgi:hypothetical protein
MREDSEKRCVNARPDPVLGPRACDSLLWSATVGAAFSGTGYYVGNNVQSLYSVYKPGTAALLQRPDNTGYLIGNAVGNIWQTPSVFIPSIPNKNSSEK